jgi:predicted CoA-binding protein
MVVVDGLCKAPLAVFPVHGDVVKSHACVHDRSCITELCSMEGKSTVVLGASPLTDRYSHLAVLRLRAHGHRVVAVGRRPGHIADVAITAAMPAAGSVGTITLYLNPYNQRSWYDAILGLGARRIVFNPGTENPELETMARERGMEVIRGCTLVMLAAGTW